MLDEAQLRALVGYDVRDRDGKSVGNVETFFNDRATGEPEWIGVFTGTFRHRHLLVPVRGAEREGNSIRLPWTKDQIHEAPDYGKTSGGIPEEMEREAYRCFALEPAAAGAPEPQA